MCRFQIPPLKGKATFFSWLACKYHGEPSGTTWTEPYLDNSRATREKGLQVLASWSPRTSSEWPVPGFSCEGHMDLGIVSYEFCCERDPNYANAFHPFLQCIKQGPERFNSLPKVY